MNTRFSSSYAFLFAIVLGSLSCGGGETGLFCTKQMDCGSQKPICSLAVCTGCGQDTDCLDNWTQRKAEAMSMSMSVEVTPTVACEVSTGTCHECLNDAQCAEARPDKPDLRVCNSTTHTCVGCLQSPDCSNNAVAKAAGLLTCDTGKNICIDCMSASDCSGRVGMPYCANGRCSQCESDSHCSGSTPYCVVPSGGVRKQCEGCSAQPSTFCSDKNVATPVCSQAGTCAPCSKHEDCAASSGVCHRPGDYTPPTAAGTLTVGQCVPKTFVQDVDPGSIAGHLANASGAPYLRLQDGSYGDLTAARDVVLVGVRNLDHATPDAAKALIASLTVTAGRVTLYDLKAERPTTATAKTLIKCTGGRLQLRLARLFNRSLEYGIDASTGCQEVRITQSTVSSDWQALLLTAPSLSYHVSNCLIARSGISGGPPFHSNAVELGGTATGTFAHNSLYMNERGIACNNNQAIANSAIVGGATSSSTSGCTKQSLYENLSGTASGDFTENPGPPSTNSVIRVNTNNTAVTTALKAKAAQAITPAITVDLFGGSRPRPAPTSDIGCEELP